MLHQIFPAHGRKKILKKRRINHCATLCYAMLCHLEQSANTGYPHVYPSREKVNASMQKKYGCLSEKPPKAFDTFSTRTWWRGLRLHQWKAVRQEMPNPKANVLRETCKPLVYEGKRALDQAGPRKTSWRKSPVSKISGGWVTPSGQRSGRHALTSYWLEGSNQARS